MSDTPPLYFAKHLGMLKPEPHQLRALIKYDPDSGKLYWRMRPAHMFRPGVMGQEAAAKSWNTRYAGKEAFSCLTAQGYLQGQLQGSRKAHQVAWAIYHGRWPSEIDHINGDKTDNRIANLREVSRRENSQNRRVRSDSMSGVQGVSARNGKWRARIFVSGKLRQIGTFATKEEAEAARLAAEVEHGFHVNHGRKS